MRKFAAAGLVVLLALSSSALVFGQGAPRNITVLANYTFHGRHSPFFVALDKGFFDQAGFKVDIQPATQRQQPLPGATPDGNGELGSVN